MASAVDEKEKNVTDDEDFKKRIVFIRHGNSLWNKKKGDGATSKLSAMGQGMFEFVKINYYDSSLYKSSTILDAPLSEIGIQQCKRVSGCLLEKQKSTKDELNLKANYMKSHHMCNQNINSASILLRDLLNKNENLKTDYKDLLQIQNHLTDATHEMVTKIDRFQLNLTTEIADLQNLESVFECLLTSKPNDSIVVCSNLRRAISTSIITLWKRLSSNQKEKLYILPCLRELGHGVDTATPLDKQSYVNNVGSLKNSKWIKKIQKSNNEDNLKEQKFVLSEFEENCHGLNMTLHNKKGEINEHEMGRFYARRLVLVDDEEHINQSFMESLQNDVDGRIYKFMQWAFENEFNKGRSTIIVVGHHHWFKAFFNKYLLVDHVIKQKKFANCGVIAFDVYKNYHFNKKTIGKYSILPESIMVLHEGEF